MCPILKKCRKFLYNIILKGTVSPEIWAFRHVSQAKLKAAKGFHIFPFHWQNLFGVHIAKK
jgi:hypothetical protein